MRDLNVPLDFAERVLVGVLLVLTVMSLAALFGEINNQLSDGTVPLLVGLL